MLVEGKKAPPNSSPSLSSDDNMSRASSPLRSALKHGADGKAERQSAAGYSRGVGFDIFSSNQAPAATGGTFRPIALR